MSSAVGYGVWAFVGALGVVLWGASHVAAGRRTPARPSLVLTRLAADPWLRVVLLAGWAWVGWHLFAR